MRQTIGVLLVIIGVAYFVFHGFSYTSREKLLDVGTIEATATSHKDIIPYTPVLGGAIIAGGVILFIAVIRRTVL